MTFHVNFVRQESTKSRVFFFHINSFLSGVTTLVNLEALERLIPCPSTGPKMFCAGPNFLSQSKTLIAFSASLFKNFCAGTKTEWKLSFGVAQNVWEWTKLYINL